MLLHIVVFCVLMQDVLSSQAPLANFSATPVDWRTPCAPVLQFCPDPASQFTCIGAQTQVSVPNACQQARLRRAAQYAATVTSTTGNTLSATGESTHAKKKMQSEVPTPSSLKGPNFPLSFVAIGDWGLSDDPAHESATGDNSETSMDSRKFNAQANVARHMAEWACAHKASFVVGHGDNFYNYGINSVHDHRWNVTFEQTYSDKCLMIPWYNVMGNHDYGAGVGPCGPSGWNSGVRCSTDDEWETEFLKKFNAQKHYKSPHKRWFLDHYYKVSHFASSPNVTVDIFSIDGTAATGSVPAQICCQCLNMGQDSRCKKASRGDKYCVSNELYDRCMGLLNGWWEDSLVQLKRDLAASTADWKIVNNHYILANYVPDQSARLLAILREGKAQIMIGGHEHYEGHIVKDGINHFHNGGGGGATGDSASPANPTEGDLFELETYAFQGWQANKDYLRVDIIDDTGNKIYCALIAQNSSVTNC